MPLRKLFIGIKNNIEDIIKYPNKVNDIEKILSTNGINIKKAIAPRKPITVEAPNKTCDISIHVQEARAGINDKNIILMGHRRCGNER